MKETEYLNKRQPRSVIYNDIYTYTGYKNITNKTVFKTRETWVLFLHIYFKQWVN